MSSSRFSRGASRRKPSRKAARSTEGVFPAAAAKKKTRAIPTAAERRFRLPRRVVSSPGQKAHMESRHRHHVGQTRSLEGGVQPVREAALVSGDQSRDKTGDILREAGGNG